MATESTITLGSMAPDDVMATNQKCRVLITEKLNGAAGSALPLPQQLFDVFRARPVLSCKKFGFLDDSGLEILNLFMG